MNLVLCQTLYQICQSWLVRVVAAVSVSLAGFESYSSFFHFSISCCSKKAFSSSSSFAISAFISSSLFFFSSSDSCSWAISPVPLIEPGKS